MASGLLFMLILCGLGIGANAGFPFLQDMNCNFCPPGWDPYGGVCYMFVETEKDWADAEKYCNLFGGNLASLQGKDQCKFIRDLIYRAAGCHKQTWVGGNDAVKEGVWFWSNGKTFDFSSWGPGEPKKGEHHHCMDINVLGQEYVGDAKCCQKKSFVCAMKP